MKKGPPYHTSVANLQELAQRLQQGDAEAMESIYRAYFQKLLFYGIQVAGPSHTAEVEDVIQEFFIWLAENKDKIHHIRDFETYLFQSVRRNLQSRLGTRQNTQATFERFVHRTAPLRESVYYSPEQLHIRQEELENLRLFIHQALDKLPTYLKEVLYLRYFEEKSYPEIAAILEVSDQVAYNYTFRAIKRLKEQLTGHKLLFLLYGLVRMLF